MMMLETETVLDRRRLRRHLTVWRILAVIAIALTAGALAYANDGLSGLTGRPQIARVAIEGTISENRDQLKMLKRVADAAHVEALLLYVNSPGGTTTGGEALYDALREIAKKKPVVAQFGTVAASAGYIVGLATDHIVARGNSITGSVGVLIQWPEVSELMTKLGVKVNEIKSGDLKAVPNFFQPLESDGRKVTEEMIADGFRWFLSLVEARRGIKTADVPGLEQGRIFSGRQAVAYKLVDEIGGEETAVRWLEEKRNVTKGLKVVDWKPAAEGGWGLSAAVSGLFTSLATAARDAIAGIVAQASSLSLDGLVSVWHPSEN